MKAKILLSFAASVLYLLLITSTGCIDNYGYSGKMQAKIYALQSALNNGQVEKSTNFMVISNHDALCSISNYTYSFCHTGMPNQKLQYLTGY